MLLFVVRGKKIVKSKCKGVDDELRLFDFFCYINDYCFFVLSGRYFGKG